MGRKFAGDQSRYDKAAAQPDCSSQTNGIHLPLDGARTWRGSVVRTRARDRRLLCTGHAIRCRPAHVSVRQALVGHCASDVVTDWPVGPGPLHQVMSCRDAQYVEKSVRKITSVAPDLPV